MKKKIGFWIGLMILLSVSTVAWAQSAKYVGPDKCKICHKKAKKDGNAFGIWKKSKHAGAFKTLASAEAKANAKKLGVTTDPQKSLECLICHVPGADLPASRFAASFEQADGVQCENCHGPGSKYRKKKIMKQLRAERLAGGTKLAKKYDYMVASKSTCETCHQPKRTVGGKTFTNPAYKPFDYAKQFKKIAHPVP